MKLKQQQLWIKVVLINFFMAAIIGALLRLAFVVEMPFMNYSNALHAHSHVAMMGWLFGALYILLSFLYLARHAKFIVNFFGFFSFA